MTNRVAITLIHLDAGVVRIDMKLYSGVVEEWKIEVR